MPLTPKKRVIGKFQANRQRSLEFLRSLPLETWETYRQGKWGLREIVAHLIGWTYVSAEAMEELSVGKRPGYDEYDFGG